VTPALTLSTTVEEPPLQTHVFETEEAEDLPVSHRPAEQHAEVEHEQHEWSEQDDHAYAVGLIQAFFAQRRQSAQAASPATRFE
jgi:hypothetical protein